MILIKGLYYVNNYIAEGYNNEYLQAVVQGYEFIQLITYMKRIIKIINIMI